MYAHSLSNRPRDAWEPLAHHLRNVGDRAAAFAAPFGQERVAEVLGLLHDIGKASAEFQNYIASVNDGEARGPDHSTAGAREAVQAYPGALGRMMAYAIAGHHGGLADMKRLAQRLDCTAYAIKDYAGWRDSVGALPHAGALVSKLRMQRSAHPGFSEAFLTRMLFSCLVDARTKEPKRFSWRQTTSHLG